MMRKGALRSQSLVGMNQFRHHGEVYWDLEETTSNETNS